MSVEITYDGDDGSALVRQVLRDVAGYEGCADIDHDDPDTPAAGEAAGSVVVLGVDAADWVQVQPWDAEHGGRDNTADPFLIPLCAIRRVHIY